MQQCDNPTADPELLEMLKEDNTIAFDVLFNRYWKLLFVAAHTRLNDEEAAKDLVQNLLIEVWQKRNELQINTTLEQYLFGAVKLKVLHHFRSESIRQNAMDNALARMADLIDGAETLSSYFDLEKIVSQEVEEMPVNMKRSFLLRSDSYTVKEIAENLNLAEQTVSNNITEALKRLKRRLKMEYPDRYMNCFICLAILFTQT
ncbi:RNA polymerase sigma factor [Mucilaginibacter paludis]|uniref:RNA polymerase, sigma-24 subunit, ECF subfamily n=1 Tax=Mucilaginibacter paludis DSM 18603 TaxID=714943 RepID=H1Y2A4_9SPHI|nr:sigma-70 family RNA polymerase sigma factor [Mucilaginibacter paludis]EHQ27884.1 RNA polymerase, sigma-24 subunit, ECF subfamily [Mucilaginibacter paludis DSM 18603]